jgi:hypothetical protein
LKLKQEKLRQEKLRQEKLRRERENSFVDIERELRIHYHPKILL